MVESQVLSVVKDIRPLLNVLKMRGHKFLFMVVDDLWLYQYHQQEYGGIVHDVFKTISFVQEKQWEIVGLQPYLNELKDKLEDIPKYNVYSNLRYMEEARNNNLLLDNILDFLLFSVPLTLLTCFLFYRLFFCLFDY